MKLFSSKGQYVVENKKIVSRSGRKTLSVFQGFGNRQKRRCPIDGQKSAPPRMPNCIAM
jgi:hypothetical protein